MKVLKVTAFIVVLLLVTSSVAFAYSGNGPDYDTCPKDEMTPEDVSIFEEIIATFKAAMDQLRGIPGMHDERLELKVEKRDSLREIVSEEFKDRYDNFTKEARQMRQSNGNKNGRLSAE